MSKRTKKFLIGLTIFVFLIIICNGLAYQGLKDNKESNKKEIDIINGIISTPEIAEEIKTAEGEKSTETISQKNAVKQARSYIETMPFNTSIRI